MPEIRPVSDASIAEGAARLRRGELVAFPTETVYGLGASTLDAAALRRLYEAKGRPVDNPVIAHVLDSEAARRIVSVWDGRARSLAERFWPGPLTLVLPRSAAVPEEGTGGRDTVAVRSPAHSAARRLLRAFGGPVSAPSANRSGHVSPTAAAHVAADFADLDLLILDDGACPLGIESTVVDLSGPTPRLLRPGSVTQAEIESTIGPIDAPTIEGQDASPGTRERHYAPATPTAIAKRDGIEAALRASAERIAVLTHSGIPMQPPHAAIPMPVAANAYATRLYAALREADALGATRILIEEPPSRDGVWSAIEDRLGRAAGSRTK